MKDSAQPRTLIVALVGIVCLIYLGSRFIPKPGINDVATSYVAALLTGRPEAMHRHLTRQESQAASLTSQGLTSFFNRFIRDNLGKAQLVSRELLNRSEPIGRQYVLVNLDNQGEPIEFVAEAFVTPEGPKVVALSSLVHFAMVLEPGYKPAPRSEGFTQAQTAAWLRKHQDELAQMGITKVFTADEGVRTISSWIDELELAKLQIIEAYRSRA